MHCYCYYWYIQRQGFFYDVPVFVVARHLGSTFRLDSSMHSLVTQLAPLLQTIKVSQD